MQYYLWWSPQTSPQVHDLSRPPESIVVRAIRHHDDHSRLSAGDDSDYVVVETKDLVSATEDLLGPTPTTPEQLSFVEDAAPIRVLLGKPGAGKTTALLNAIEARAGQKVLYVTWSERLSEVARTHAEAFAPPDTNVDAISFSTLMSRILGRDVKTQTTAESRKAFADLLNRVAPAEFGPWASFRDGAYAEVRAYLLGRATHPSGENAGGLLPRQSVAEYEQLRGPLIGTTAAQRLLQIVNLAERNGSLNDVFPELVAAHEAISVLSTGKLPEGYSGFNKIAVDEAQDLTSLEMSVILELVRAIARANDGRAPSLIIAADEGQTVRPSGFEVADLKRKLQELHPAQEHKLHAPLRYPKEVATVIDNAQRLYKHLDRALAPTNQAQIEGGDHVCGQVRHVVEGCPETARRMLLELSQKKLESVLFVAAGDSPPDWIGHELKETVLLPHEAKGLEYQTVVVLDPEPILADLQPGSGSEKLRAVEMRTSIDRLRVAMTRATENLIFFDVGSTPEHGAESRRLLEKASLDGETVFTTLFATDEDDVEPGERVLRLVIQSRNLRDERPDAAWHRAYHAMELLGEPDTPQGVSDRAIRAEAYQEVCDSVIRFVARSRRIDAPRKNALSRAADRLTHERNLPLRFKKDMEKLVETLPRLAAEPARCAIDLVAAVTSMGKDSVWVQPALASVSESIRTGLDTAATDAVLAERFKSSRLRSWLAVTGYGGDPIEKVRSMRRVALKTLLAAGDTQGASKVHEAHDGDTTEDHELTGRLRYVQGRYREAAAAYERAANYSAAVVAWRQEAEWEQAARLSDRIPEGQAQELAWLLEASNLASRRPAGLNDGLSAAERARLSKE